MVNKISSNVTGLRYAEEVSPKTLAVTPLWYPLEPNGYTDFGGQITNLPRDPINPSRQRRKGATVDLEAGGGFNQDLTQNGLRRLFQGFFWAEWREKGTNAPTNDDVISFSGILEAGNIYTAAYTSAMPGFSGMDTLLVDSLALFTGFNESENNGLKRIASIEAGVPSDNVTTVEDAADEPAPPTDAKMQVVGYQFDTGDVGVVQAASVYPYLNREAGVFDFTDLGLIPGEWVFIGGDHEDHQFAVAGNNGFARVRSVEEDKITFDKTQNTMVTNDGAGKSIRIFFGNILRNEPNPNDIVRRTYQLERTLGHDGTGVMSEYLLGAYANQATIQTPQAGKVSVDLSFVAMDNEQRTGATGVKAGTRPALVEESMFNTSTDLKRVSLHLVTDGESHPNSLFAFITEAQLTIDNNVTPDKAVSMLGAFDATEGQFIVSGSMTAYFASVQAVQAIRNNRDVSLDMVFVKENAGLVFDIPLIALGEGRLNIEMNRPIMLPLAVNAAESGRYGYTLLMNEFPYLPDWAED